MFIDQTIPTCRSCGGTLTLNADGECYICSFCRREYPTQAARQHAQTMALFDELERRKIEKLLQKRYKAITAEYISREAVVSVCDEILSYLPDDFLSNFYMVAAGNNSRALNRAIRDMDTDAHADDMSEIIPFLVKSLTESRTCLLSLSHLVERAYSGKSPDLYEKYATLVEKQIERVDGGVYDTSLPRDVFVAYSGRDMATVHQVIEALEGQGVSCFAAMRNLRHGIGAVEDYNAALEEAMDNCTIFLFLSSPNSRHKDCDAVRVEMKYIRTQDVAGAPTEYRFRYESIPHKFKKPRIEFYMGDSPTPNIAERTVKQFFDGYERVYTVDSLIERVADLMFGVEVSEPPTPPTPPQPAAEELYQTGRGYYDGANYTEAVKWFRQAAERRNINGQNALGECYSHGRGVSQDYTEAAKWYRLSAEQGDRYAQNNLGLLYYSGQGVPQDYAEAAKWFRQAAEQGDAWAQYNLGLCYNNGQGVAQDSAEAVRWYRLSAEQGNFCGQYMLGWHLKYGRGVPQNLPESFHWLLESAKQGHAAAQCEVGRSYHDARGVAQNYNEAMTWYRKAAEQGHAEAENLIAYCYENGYGVPKDSAEAVRWYRKAAERGYILAQNYLGYCYKNGWGVPQDYNETAKWYRKAADQGHADAQNNIGICYFYGEGVPQDYAEAARWYRMGAEQGHVYAQHNLASCYRYGNGVPQDVSQAVRWFRLAAEQGDEKSRQQLRELGYS